MVNAMLLLQCRVLDHVRTRFQSNPNGAIALKGVDPIYENNFVAGNEEIAETAGSEPDKGKESGLSDDSHAIVDFNLSYKIPLTMHEGTNEIQKEMHQSKT